MGHQGDYSHHQAERVESERLSQQDPNTFTPEDSARFQSLDNAVQASNDLQQNALVPAAEPSIADVPVEQADQVPIFYSPLELVVEAKMPNNASPEQVLGIVQNSGIAPDEARWMGLEEF